MSATAELLEVARGSRLLRTELRVPAAEPPWPLAVFAHGWTGHPRKFTRLFGSWTAAGLAVAAPAFPLTNDRAPRQVFAGAMRSWTPSRRASSVLLSGRRRGGGRSSPPRSRGSIATGSGGRREARGRRLARGTDGSLC